MSRADLVALHEAGMLSASEVEESIEHLAFDLRHATRPIERHVVFGVLKKRGAPWVSQKYLEELESQIAEQQAAAERYRQMREEKRLAESPAGFEQWFSALTQEQRQALAQGSPFRGLEGPGFKSLALSHFQRHRGGGGECIRGLECGSRRCFDQSGAWDLRLVARLGD